MSPRSFLNDESLVRLHITPALGDIRLEQLRSQHIRRLLHDLRERGYSSSQLHHVYTLLNKALTLAVREHLLTENPCATVSRPTVERKEIAPLSEEEAHALLRQTSGTTEEALILTAVVTGARQGELAALRWQDVDLEAGTMRIARSVTRHTRSWAFKDPKTRAGIRHVSLPAGVVEGLRGQRRQVAEMRLAASTWEDHDLVFPRVDGTPQYGQTMLKTLHAHMDRAGIPRRRFHDLRHTAVTLMLEHGVALTTISDLVGHSSYRITKDVYGHLTPALRSDAAERMQGFLAGTRLAHEEHA